jgi:glycosyltransferase involved in cell wall biosynthesis
MAALTRRTLRTASALHADCQRDRRLAASWGFDPSRPAVVLPGAGGIQAELFYPPPDESQRHTPVVVNPRGFRVYVRNDTFFKSIPLVLAHIPQARFLCPTMAGEAGAERWLDQLGIRPAVELLPHLPRPQMGDLFRAARVAVSPSTHDGTPNTLLEAMACGCYPVVGDLDSLREWITPGVNGSLVAPGSPAQAAEAILGALQSPERCEIAAARNLQIIRERAEYRACMAQAEAFYRSLG